MDKFEKLMEIIHTEQNLCFNFVSNVFLGVHFILYNDKGKKLLRLKNEDARQGRDVCLQLGIPQLLKGVLDYEKV